MLRRMAGCHIVTIPLMNLDISAGQLVILQAMLLGKPVICTMSNGIKDYVVDGETGILVRNDKEEWQKAVKRLYDDVEFYEEMCRKAKQAYQEHFTEKVMYERIAEMV